MKKILSVFLIIAFLSSSCAVLDGAGANNTLSKYTSDYSIGLSSLTDNGTDLSVPAGYKIDGVDISTLGGGSTNLTGAGTANTITKWTGATALGNSAITDNGTINFSENVTLPAGYTVDGVDISTLGAASGNITGAGTNGYITQFNGSSNITNATNTNAQVASAVSSSHTQNTDTNLAAVGTKNPPIDADKSLYRDSTNLDVLVTSTWLQIKAFFKTYFDTIYASITSANVTTLGGTTNTLTKFTGANSIGNAPITDNGTINFSENVTLPVGYTVDGVDISTLTSSGNVTVTTGVANKIPVFSGATSVINSQITDNTTWIATTGNIQTANITATNITVSNNITVSGNITATQNITAKQLVSTVATGTPPLVVSSTTNVTNLNADLLDGNHASAFATTSSANVTSTGGTVNTISKFTGSASIANSSLTDDGTTITSTADISLGTGKNLRLFKGLTNDVTFSGVTFTGTAGEALTEGQTVYLKNDGKYYKTDADTAATMPCVAMSSAQIAINTSGVFLVNGFMRFDDWTWSDEGVELYVSGTAGAMTATAPTGANTIIQKVATVVAIAASGAKDIVYFNPAVTLLMDTPADSILNAAPTANWAFDHAASSGNVTTVTGLANTIPKYDGASSIARSSITDNGTTVNVSSNITLPANFTVDGVDVSGHADRHSWLGADPLNAKDIMALAYPYAFWGFGDAGGYIELLTGGRGSSYTSSKALEVTSGNQINDVTGRTAWEPFWFSQANVNYNMRFGGTINYDIVTDVEIWVGFFPDEYNFPTTTMNHVGFRFLNGTLYASNGNGVNGTQTQVGTGINAWDERSIGFKYMTSDIKFYLQNLTTPVATHTTNEPDSLNLKQGIFIKTTSAAAKRGFFNSVKIIGGAE